MPSVGRLKGGQSRRHSVARLVGADVLDVAVEPSEVLVAHALHWWPGKAAVIHTELTRLNGSPKSTTSQVTQSHQGHTNATVTKYWPA